jgi:2-polyprenyl-6-methoxyphenol hydroxylase-like FAD-dependent oxidoreductase
MAQEGAVGLRIAVTGAGAGGLFAALLLARRGHDVVVFEQDRFDPAADVEAAAAAAYRPTAPQIVQPHVVMARCRQLLRERLPDVYERLLAAGVVEASISDWMPDTLGDRSPRPGDEQLSPLLTRRSTLDWVLRRAALDQPGVALRCGVRVVGLVARPGKPRRVAGLRTDDEQVSFDLVIDACGRRTPLDGWLPHIGARPPATCSADSGVAYFSRHYRVRPGPRQDTARTSRIVAALEEFTLAVFGADNDAMQFAIVPLSADRRFRRLQNPDVFTAVLRTIPACDSWLEVLDPISPVFRMTGPRNTLRRLVHDGTPIVTGLHAVGDSVCTTNPTFGRGLSLAMWAAADLTDVLDTHPDDPAAQALALDQRIAAHIAPYYEEQATVDATRLATLRHTIFGDDPPPPLASDLSRVSFAQLRAAASYDPTVFRAFWTLTSMLATPDEVYSDPSTVASTIDTLKARDLEIRQPRAHLDSGVLSPTRQQLLAALATDPAPTTTR